MGNSPSKSEENSISIIKTEGNQISGISLIYNKEDEDKLLAKIQETLDTRTEAFGFNEPEAQPESQLELEPDTNGDRVYGISLVYNKSDEDKLFTKIKEIFDTRTEGFGFNEPELEPIKDLREILEQKYEEELPEEELPEKKELPEEVKNLIKKIEEILVTKTETFNS